MRKVFSILLISSCVCAQDAKPRMLNGLAISQQNAPAVAVIVSTIDIGTVQGTGVLIDASHILTAGHVLLDVANNTASTSISIVLNGENFTVAPSAVTFNPAFNVSAAANENIIEGNFDAAIITLPTPITDVTPIPILRHSCIHYRKMV